MRIKRYLNQVDMVTKLLNPHQDRKIRQLTTLDKFELLERIYITDNNKAEYGNNGKLNQKVVHKLAAKWGSKIKSMENLEDVLKQIQPEILPELEGDRGVDGKHWRQYRSNVTVFNLKPFTAKRSREDKPNNPPNAPDRKRRKIQPSTSQTNKINDTLCKYKANCKNFMNTTCKYRHTITDIQKMVRKKRKDKKLKEDKFTNNRSKPNITTNKYQPQSKSKDVKLQSECKRGQKCKYWQLNKCHYYHNDRKMQCKCCGKYGHPEIKCYQYKASIKTGQSKFPKYNPSQQLNAEASWKEITATNQALYQKLAIHQQQFPHYNPQLPYPPSPSPQEQPTSNTNNLSPYQAFIMSNDVKRKYKEEMQAIRDRIDPRMGQRQQFR